MAIQSRKLYYSIAEVSKMLNVACSQLRYWESEFPHIRPKTNARGVRRYTEANIEDLKLIYNLIKVRGFRISAARKIVYAKRGEASNKQKLIERLIFVRDELQELKRHLDQLV